MAEFPQYIEPNFFLDIQHPAVAAFAGEHGQGSTPTEVAISLYYAVRDGLLYTPWNVGTKPEEFRASVVAARTFSMGGHCIDKAVLLAACARFHEIPSRLHFANVRNHIGTAKLEEQLGTDLLVFHGYTELYLEGSWTAATPAFNKGLCDRLGVEPLAFDGKTDSIFQQYDRAGGLFMQYVHDYGTFPDIPFELMTSEWDRYYGPNRITTAGEGVAR